MTQRDDAVAIVLQGPLDLDAEAAAARADRPTLMGLAPIDSEASDAGEANAQEASDAAAIAPGDGEPARPEIETSTVRPMQLLASECASQADAPPTSATAVASEPPRSPEEADPEWLDLSTRWLITPRPRKAPPLVDEDEVTEHLHWAERFIVHGAPRDTVAPPPPPLTAAHPNRRVTMAYGRPSELPPARPYAAPPAAAAMPQPGAATWSAPAMPAGVPPWAAGTNHGAAAHYAPPSRPALHARRSGRQTGYMPFEPGTRRMTSRRARPSELSLELWQSISDTWPATLIKWVIALVMLHYSGLAVPVLAFFGYAPAQPGLSAGAGASVAALQPAAAPVAATLAAPSVIPERAIAEELSSAGTPRRFTPHREISGTAEIVTRKPAHRPRTAASLSHKSTQVGPAAQQSAAPRGVTPVVTAAAQPQPYAAAVESEEAAGEAFLRINSRPWSQVFVDGTHVGHTPKLDLRVRAGAHRVRFVNSELGVSKTVDLRASAGETVSHVEFLEE